MNAETITTPTMIIVMGFLLLAVLIGGSAWVGYRTFRRSLDRKIAVEKVQGNTKLRRTMQGRVGRRMQPERLTYVERAETMRGWVWIVTTKTNGRPLTENVGWAPTNRAAKRHLAKFTGNERGEADAFSLVMLILGVLAFAVFAPHIADKLLGTDFAGWLRHVGHALFAWLRSL